MKENISLTYAESIVLTLSSEVAANLPYRICCAETSGDSKNWRHYAGNHGADVTAIEKQHYDGLARQIVL